MGPGHLPAGRASARTRLTSAAPSATWAEWTFMGSSTAQRAECILSSCMERLGSRVRPSRQRSHTPQHV